MIIEKTNSNEIISGIRKKEFLSGMKAMIPFLLSIIPMALIGGVYGISSGLTAFQTIELAMAVNSGTVQFIGTKLFQSGANGMVILLTSFVLSLRLIVYSTMLRSYMKHISQRWRILLGFGMIDAVFFAVQKRLSNSSEKHQEWKWYYFGASFTLFMVWMLSTVIGTVIGSSLPNLMLYGLDFPMTAIFTAMFASTLINWKIWIAVTVAGFFALVGYKLPCAMNLITAILGGTTIGYVCDFLEKSFLKMDGVL